MNADTGSTLLPSNASVLERALEHAFAVALEAVVPPFPALLDPRTAPAAFLPYLAADRGVSEWASTDDLAEKRRTIASAWAIKRKAGTFDALRLAVESLGLEAEITPWHKSADDQPPYSIRVVARALGAMDERANERLSLRLADALSERDILSFTVQSEVRGRLYYGAAVSTGSTTTVYPYSERESEVQGRLYYGTGLQEFSTTTVYPQ